MNIADFQKRIEELYGQKDSARGVEGTFMWFSEEVGELSRAIRRGDRENLEEEFADVLAWLVTLGSMLDVDIQSAAEKKYGSSCPKCKLIPCGCKEPTPLH